MRVRGYRGGRKDRGREWRDVGREVVEGRDTFKAMCSIYPQVTLSIAWLGGLEKMRWVWEKKS